MAGGAHSKIAALAIHLQPRAHSSPEVIGELVHSLAETPGFGHEEELVAAVQEREAQASTYFGHGIALPHARVGAQMPWMVAFGRFDDGLTWAADAEPVRFVFLSLVPMPAATAYLGFIQKLGRAVRDTAAREALATAAGEDAVRHWMRRHLGAA